MILHDIKFYLIKINNFEYGKLNPSKDSAISKSQLDISDLRLIYLYSEVTDYYRDDPSKDYGLKAFLGRGSYATIGVKNGEVILDDKMDVYIRVNWTELTGRPRVFGLQERLAGNNSTESAKIHLYREASAEHANFIMHAFKNNYSGNLA